jgi:hypothetical protein
VSVPFAAILTTNYDTLIEDAFSPARPKYTQLDSNELTSWPAQEWPAVFKIHGDIDRAASIVLTADSYRSLKFARDVYRQFLTHIFTTKTVLFVGFSLSDPDLLLFLEELKYVTRDQLHSHFALMRTKGMNRLVRSNFEKQYGVRVLGDDQSDGHPDIAGFLAQLPRQSGPATPATAGRSAAPVVDPRRLLEAMGQTIHDAKEQYLLGEYRAGAETRTVATRFLVTTPAVADVERLHQAIATYGMKEGMLLCGGALPGEIAVLAQQKGLQAYTVSEFIARLADFRGYLARLRKEYEESGIERYFVPLKLRAEKDGKPAPLRTWTRSSNVGWRTRRPIIFLSSGISEPGKPGFAGAWRTSSAPPARASPS